MPQCQTGQTLCSRLTALTRALSTSIHALAFVIRLASFPGSPRCPLPSGVGRAQKKRALGVEILTVRERRSHRKEPTGTEHWKSNNRFPLNQAGISIPTINASVVSRRTFRVNGFLVHTLLTSKKPRTREASAGSAAYCKEPPSTSGNPSPHPSPPVYTQPSHSHPSSSQTLSRLPSNGSASQTA